MSNEPFVRKHFIDEPGLAGADWWNETMAASATVAKPARRAVLLAVAATGIIGVAGALAVCGLAADDEPEFTTEKRASLDLQKQHGWSFGAATEALTFASATAAPVDKAALAQMAAALTPKRSALKPFYSGTLFQSPTALPTAPVEGDSPTAPLADVLQPVKSADMDLAFERGKGIASLFRKGAGQTALVIDLQGPESVALAAGAATVFDPVFWFDNWPHPRGVVPSHMTLAAAVNYQDLFTRLAGQRGDNAPPAFVLDRARLTPYTDEANQFDNRYWARLPTPEQVKAMGIKQVLYVVPTAADRPELDDLNADFVAWKAAGIDVRMVAATDFRRDTEVPPAVRAELEKTGDYPGYYYGGDDETHESFWTEYAWTDGSAGAAEGTAKGKTAAAKTATGVSNGDAYTPSTRSTLFSGTGLAKVATGVAIGTAAVAIAAGTGRILGSRLSSSAGSRSGSYTRSSGRSSFG